jgi:hypothetical protein
LREQHHRQERRRVRVLAGTGISVQPCELGLKSLVEQPVALQPKEGVELSVSLEPTNDELLLAVSPPASLGTRSTGVTGIQGPTRWRADGSSP